jgi:predicted nucleotidyltransferase
MEHRARPTRAPRDPSEVLEALRALLPELRQRYAVRTLALFGSYARGEARAASDVDLLVEFDRVPSLLKLIEVEEYLTDRVGVKVDLVMRDDLRPVIAERVVRESVPV